MIKINHQYSQSLFAKMTFFSDNNHTYFYHPRMLKVLKLKWSIYVITTNNRTSF